MAEEEKLFSTTHEETFHTIKKRKSLLKYFEETLEIIFEEKAPTLSEVYRDIFTILAPWIVSLFIILTAPIAFTVLFYLFNLMYVLGIKMGIAHAVVFGSSYLASKTLVVISTILNLAALPGLFRRKGQAWHLVYYSTIIVMISNIIYLSPGGLILNILWFYFLFQVKEHFTS